MTTSPVFTLAFAAAAGVFLVIMANRLKLPSIALLLIGGVALGPAGFEVIDPAVLGRGLKLVVGLAVAIILFEGGLTLDVAGARRNPAVIRRLLSLGVLITWLGSALAIKLIFGLDLAVAMLAGSLVIVTGPTVISPLLRRIAVRERIKDVLYWEAVLVDAIGVFIAVLCFEYLFPSGAELGWSPLVRFGARVALGAGIGIASGGAVALILRRHLIPEEQVNIFVLAMALLSYGVSEAILHEAGILAVIITGLVTGLVKTRQMAQIKRFKLELTEVGIGMLFILLAAKLDLGPFMKYGWKLVAVIAILVLVLRPVVILVATWRQGFSAQEKLFLSWIAPRGIVAAFMASLFSLEMASHPSTAVYGEILETFTFGVIGTTVILQGLSAPWVARLLRLEAEPRLTWLFVGQGEIASAMASAARDAGARAIALAPPDQAADDSVDLIRANPLDRDLFDDPRLGDVGAVVTLSPNPYFNQLVCQRWTELLGGGRCFRIPDASVDSGHSPTVSWGIPVWKDVEPPGELLHGLETGRLAISAIRFRDDSDKDRLGIYLLPLLRVYGEADVRVVNDANVRDVSHGMFVVIRKRVPGLAELIHDAVVIDELEPTFELVVRRLLEQAARTQQSLPIEELTHSIIERERSMPTAMGAGVAIPHAYHSRFDCSRCYVANVTAGLGEKGPDGHPIRLVFLVLSPVGRAEEHLKSLATIAQLTSDGVFTDVLEQQTSREKLLARLVDRA